MLLYFIGLKQPLQENTEKLHRLLFIIKNIINKKNRKKSHESI